MRILKDSRTPAIKCLLRSKSLIEKGEQRWRLNRLYITPIISWFQELEEEEYFKMAHEIEAAVAQIPSKENINKVIKSIGISIYKICKKILLANKWDYILDMVFASPEKYSQGQEKIFESNLHIISELIGSIATLSQDKEKINQIKIILSTAFAKGNNKMKENATECLGYLIQNIDIDNLDVFKDF